MMISRLLIIALLLGLASCKSYEFKAQNKSELAKVCLAEFPPNYEPTDMTTNTIYEDRIEWVEVDCDTIGKKEVPHVCKEKIVKETIYTADPRQAYLIQNLEGKLELSEERIKQKDKLHREELENINRQHKEEKESLKTKYKNETESIRKDRNKWRWIVILMGAILGIGVIRKLKII